MENKEYFKLSRFWLVAKRDMIENWKQNLYKCVALYAILLFFLVFQFIHAYATEGTFHVLSCSFWTWTWLAFSFGGMYVASTIMGPMADKSGRLAMLMLPATNLEKFVWRALYVSVGFIVMFAVALAAISLTRFLLVPLFGFGADFCEPFLKHLPHTLLGVPVFDVGSEFLPKPLARFFACVWSLWGYSIYILGGNIWHKRAFIKTIGCLAGAFLVFLTVMVLIPWKEIRIEYFVLKYFGDVSAVSFFSVLTAILAVMTVLMWWWSYRLFCRSQIVASKKVKE